MAADTTGAPQAAAQDPNLEEWIYTFSSTTGEVLKVERVDAGSGSRQELSLDEYSALAAAYGYGAEQYDAAAYEAAAYDPYGYDEGYYQGMADFAASIGYDGGQGQMSSVEAAYYQGLADYAAALGLA
jgi:hypothetical protein